VRLACSRWGRIKRRMWHGRETYQTSGRNPTHVDGYSESFLGKIQDERVAAGQPGASSQRWDEVYWGDALDVQRALVKMPENAYDALHLKYVWDPDFGLSWSQKANLIGMKERVFWEAVGRAEFWVYARLEPGVTTIDLSLRRESGTRRAITATINKLSAADLNLAALNRRKLTIA
jgi:hypothetical protein